MLGGLFADVEQEMSADEKSVVAYYRDYQQARSEYAGSATTEADDYDLRIEKVLSECQPLLNARTAHPGAETTASPEPDNSFLARLADRLGTLRSLPVGALAAVCLAVVAVALFFNTETSDPLVELTGISSYENSIVLPLSKDLPAPAIDSMSFSPTDNDSSVAYAVGSLFGELAISVAGNDRERALQTIKRIDLISRTSPDYGDASNADGQLALAPLSTALENTRRDLSASVAPDLLDDKTVVNGLESILVAFNEASSPEELTAFQKLGSWTLVTLTLIESEKVSTDASTQSTIIDRLVADAEPIVADVQKQVGLSDAQRTALTDFSQFLKQRESAGSPAHSLSALKDVTEKIDTTFRI